MNRISLIFDCSQLTAAHLLRTGERLRLISCIKNVLALEICESFYLVQFFIVRLLLLQASTI
jgi:hypothetical protein